MAKRRRMVTEWVNGGWIKRDADTGEVREVGTDKGVSRASAKTRAVLEEVMNRRGDALKRLAKR